MPILHARELSLATSCAQDTTAIELCSSLTTHRAYRHSPTSLAMPKSKQKRTTSRLATKGSRRSARASTRASTRSTVATPIVAPGVQPNTPAATEPAQGNSELFSQLLRLLQSTQSPAPSTTYESSLPQQTTSTTSSQPPTTSQSTLRRPEVHRLHVHFNVSSPFVCTCMGDNDMHNVWSVTKIFTKNEGL